MDMIAATAKTIGKVWDTRCPRIGPRVNFAVSVM